MEMLTHVETTAKEDEVSKNMVLTLTMKFKDDNDWFKPSTLSVHLEYESEDQVKEIKGTPIEWLEGKDPTKKKTKKKQKHKKTGETRTVVKTVDADSFFNLFKDRKVSADGGDDSEDDNDARDKMDEAQQTVEDFHDLLIPEALEYYLGLNEDFDMLGMGDDDEGDDDDDDDDSDDEKPKDKKAKKSNPSAGGETEEGGEAK